MGDVIHALPAVTAIRAQHPDWQIDWVVDERWAPLLQANGIRGPVVDTAMPVAIRAWKKSPLAWKTVNELLGFRDLRGRYDYVVDMQGTLRSAAIGRLAGGHALSGYADPRESMAARFYTRRITRQGVHVVDQGSALLGAACGLMVQPAVPQLPEEAWAANWAEELIGGMKLCILAPGAGWGAKQWPAERFGLLAQRLRELGYICMVNAVRKDEPLSTRVIASSEGAAKVAICNVAGLIALVRRASLFVGGDSGPTHLAAAMGVPLVALFGPTDPQRNGPWGPGSKVVLRDAASVTSYKRRPELDPGMANLSVERVLEAVQSII